MIASIEYSTRGYFSGERNSFKATLKPLDGDDPFYTVQGVWSGVSNYVDHTKEDDDDESELFFDALVDRPVAPELKPKDEMGSLESHKLWSKVTDAINTKDYATASREKSKIEDAQRVLAKARKERGETQADALKIFVLVDEDADATGKAFQALREDLIDAVGTKALREDEMRPHWRLRK
jgi:hypothetical protein